MKTSNCRIFLLLMVFIWLSFNSTYAQPSEKSRTRFSHKGVKFALGSGSLNMTSERKLKEGDGSFLNLGYGITERISLWLSFTGSKHPQEKTNDLITNFGGLEFNVQHKFETVSRLQPYGKVGFGIFGLQEQDADIALVGAGVNLAFGLDYLFSRHFGVGAELMFKKLDYYVQRQETEGGEFVSDLNPDLNGDMVGFFITFTIQ